MSEIFIRGLEVCACHGVHDFEKTEKQRFVFDVDVSFDFSAAGKSDNLDETISYSSVADLIVKTATENSFSLLEKLATECAYAVLENFAACGVKISVNKPDAPLKHKFDAVGVKFEAKRERAYLSLGSSQGDRAEYLAKALNLLQSPRGIKIKKVSSVFETEPYGGVAKGKFLNCAAEIETFLPPETLLEEIHKIEAACGRTRDKRWCDRTLDIDIIFYGDKVIFKDGLIIPHADYYNRDFVLAPLKEIAPDFVCPLLKKRIKDL